MPEDDVLDQEHDEDSEALRQARDAGKRHRQRANEAEERLAELTASQRVSGLRQAGYDPEGYFGQSVLAAAEKEGITSADDIAALARVAAAEARGDQLTEAS